VTSRLRDLQPCEAETVDRDGDVGNASFAYEGKANMPPREASEKDSTCISPFVHPNVHVITCYSFMWPEMHASTEEFTWFLYVRTSLVILFHYLFPRGQKDSLTTLLICAN
jgi:hypothetical protein